MRAMAPRALVLWGVVAFLPSGPGAQPADVDVLFLGEQHDNPAHHARQAEIVAQVLPPAIVWEMLTPDLAAAITQDVLADEAALQEVLRWEDRGWPDFSAYYPIFAAAPDAAHFGAAVPRDRARQAMTDGVAAVFGADAALYGLTEPLPEKQQTTREALQLAAHCDAMPAEMLPLMVDIQRLRDARIAQAAVMAHAKAGGPVVVITGNGHARTDWGAPAALARVAPDLAVWALGQGETPSGAPRGTFDTVDMAAPVDRGDPCAAFRKK